MLYPYFRARQDFPLTRSEQVTADYAGRLADFAQVYRDNKALTFMRNNAEGPTEPIAFPGFTLLFLASVAVVVPVVANLRRASLQARMMHLRNLVLLAVSMASAIAISYAARDLLPGLILLGIAGALWRHGTNERLAPPSTFTHLCMLVLAVVLFLGPRPFAIHGEQMRGPYQYLYQHVPGLNGIRYVSRFVVLIMLSLAVLAGYGATLLLRGGRAWRGLGFAVLLAAMLYELRNAPMALADLPHQAHLPPVYRWLSEHPGPEPIATVPAYTLGYFGARNDYAALFHHRRTIEGKSSWMPPVTYAFIFESRRFPRDSMLRMLHALGAKYLVVRSSEYRPPERARRIVEFMRNRSNEFPLRFENGGDRVYEVLPSDDRSTSLLSTSPIPRGAKALDKHTLRGTASMAQFDAAKAFDGNPQSCWRTLSEQAAGDWFEIRLPGKRTVAAIEVDDFVDAFDAPAAFKLSVPEADGTYRAVFTRPRLRFYRDQVYHPKSFAFRVVLPQPVLTDGIRIELLDGVAGHAWSMHEAKVFVTD
ncbi:MAG: hypothetical protein ACHQ53_12670 [Polyangiales bacterium]